MQGLLAAGSATLAESDQLKIELVNAEQRYRTLEEQHRTIQEVALQNATALAKATQNLRAQKAVAATLAQPKAPSSVASSDRPNAMEIKMKVDQTLANIVRPIGGPSVTANLGHSQLPPPFAPRFPATEHAPSAPGSVAPSRADSLTKTAPPRAPRYDVLSKHVKLPTFNGTTNVETFVHLFERGCDTLGIDTEDRLTLLWSNMRGSAADWAGSMAQGGATYESLKGDLLTHFRS